MYVWSNTNQTRIMKSMTFLDPLVPMSQQTNLHNDIYKMHCCKNYFLVKQTLRYLFSK